MRKFYLILSGVCLSISSSLVSANSWVNYRDAKPNHRPHSAQRYQPPPRHTTPAHGVWRHAPQAVQPSHDARHWQQHPSAQRHSQHDRARWQRDLQQGYISDWRRHGLPEPPYGADWIYEHGAYRLVYR